MPPYIATALGCARDRGVAACGCHLPQRIDGLEIHTPALDGVSGATVWAVDHAAGDDVACVLRPAAIQVAFQHGRHLRGEPIRAATELLSRRH